MAMLAALVLRPRYLLDRDEDQAIVGVSGPGLVRPLCPPMKVSFTSSHPCSGCAGSSLRLWRNLCAIVPAFWYATPSSRRRNLAETPPLSRPTK
jgi:hypothetical protein